MTVEGVPTDAEQAAEDRWPLAADTIHTAGDRGLRRRAFVNGAQWQAERDAEAAQTARAEVIDWIGRCGGFANDAAYRAREHFGLSDGLDGTDTTEES